MVSEFVLRVLQNNVFRNVVRHEERKEHEAKVHSADSNPWKFILRVLTLHKGT